MVKSDKVISIYFLYRDFGAIVATVGKIRSNFLAAAEDRGTSCAHQNISTGRTDVKTYFINIAAVRLI